MPTTYRVTTDKGTFNVTVDDGATKLPHGASAGMLPQSTMDSGDPKPDSPTMMQRAGGMVMDAGRAVMDELSGQTPRPEGLRFGRLKPEVEQALEGSEVMGRTPLPLVPIVPGLRASARLIANAIPTRAKAGQQFQQVMSKVGDKPVDMARPGDAALRIQELAERGGSMPKSVRDLLKRATDPDKGDITYKEARDFYSNISRLSADEFQRLNPVVKMEVGKLRVALDRALAATAKAGGQEETYRAAMKQYRVASRINELSKTSLKYGAGLVGAGAAVKLASEVTGR